MALDLDLDHGAPLADRAAPLTRGTLLRCARDGAPDVLLLACEPYHDTHGFQILIVTGERAGTRLCNLPRWQSAADPADPEAGISAPWLADHWERFGYPDTPVTAVTVLPASA
ncbi:MAG: hypothetical protein LBR33_01795 [Propionibacteriaceae bacterium]|jgi:hypothetical protein|nr:hypothetical protein [Propionibacteriaceae bacterium]